MTACPAEAPVAVLEEVLAGEFVTMNAVGLLRVQGCDPSAAPEVLALRHRLQVRRVYTLT